MNDYLVDQVDERDSVIGQVSRKDAHEKRILHRAVHVWIFDSNGKILLQTRAGKGDHGDGLWDASVGGHVDAGESYEVAAEREMKEELGISGKPAFAFKLRGDDPIFPHYCSCFIFSHNGPFHTDPQETAELKFYSPEELSQNMKTVPERFTAETRIALKKILQIEEKA